MKKRLCSILLVLVMAISLLPTAAFAAGGDFNVDIVATKFSTVKYNEKETMKLDFMMKTSNGAKIRGIQTALLAIDLNKYAVLQMGTGTVYDRTDTVSTGSTVAKDYAYTKYNDEANDIKVTSKNTFLKSGTTLLMTFEADFGANDVSITESTSMMSILLGLKDEAEWSALPSDSIRLATATEADTFGASGVVTVSDSAGASLVFGHKDGTGSDTLTITPTLASDDSFSFVAPPKPAYSGTIAAPTVAENKAGKVTLNDAVITPSDSSATVQYGYSTTNDGNGITWQDSKVFNLTIGSKYYFYAKVAATDTYSERISDASAEVTVADKVLFSITISGDTTANVPTKGNTANVNLTATATYDDTSTASVTDSATWSVDPTYAGVSVSGGTVTLLPSAVAGSVTIKAACGEKEATHTITLNKAAATLTTLTISGDSSVSVPSTGDSPKETSYSVSGEDQYGAPFTPTGVLWSIDGTTPTGVSIGSSDGKLSVTNEASVGSVTIKATSSSVSATKTVSITKAPSEVSSVTISGGVSDLTIPTLTNFPGESHTDAAAFTAEVKDQYGAVMPGQTVTWRVTGNDGVTISDTGMLTVTNKASTYTVTVTAACGSAIATKTVTVTKAEAVAATFVQVKKDGAVVTGDSITITIPTSGNTTVIYTAEVYDQYGIEMDSESVNWSIAPDTMTGVSVSNGTVTVESTASAGTVTLTVASSTVSTVKATVTITLSNKTAHNIDDFTNPTVTITYGDAITGQTVNSTTGDVKYSSSDSSAVEVNETTGALTVRKATASAVTITATVAEDDTHAAASKSYTVTVNKKELTITGLTAENRNYEAGNTNVALTGGTLTGVVGSDVVSVTLPTTGTITNANAGNGKDVTVAMPTLTGADASNYTLKPITGITVNISKANPDVGTVSCSGGTIYTSTALNSITLSKTGSAAGTLKLTTGQNLTAGTNDYGWTFTPDDTDNYKTLTGTVSLTVTEDTLNSISTSGTLSKTSYKYGETFDPTGLTVTATYASGASRTLSSSEYNVANGTMAVGQTEVTLTYQGKTCTVSGLTVSKADAPSLTPINVSQKYSVTTEQSKNIGRADMPDDAGTLTYVTETPTVTSGTATVSSFAVDASGLVKYTITGGENGAVITLPVTISSTNYENSTVNVVITLTDKETPTASANNITVTYNGADVPASAITGTASVGDTSVEGTWSWKATPPKTVANSGSHVVVFTPNDAVNYAAVEVTITVTINKATPTGTPNYTAITASGKTLADAALGIGDITPAGGTIAWDLGGSQTVAANTAYAWTYTPADTANYNTLTGSITPYVVSYGGGGSVTTYSVTVGKTENGTVSVSPKSAAKGSTVTVTVTPDKGYVLETLTALDKDGKEIKLTEKDGKYTFTMPAGKVEVKATFMDDNTMLNYFVDVKAGDYFYDAVLWAAQKGITNGINDTEFGPSLSCTRAQIVTFLWRAAGSPEPKGTGSFADVPADSYYAKAVAWAVENGITGGTGSGQFDPDATCTREQAVTFLYRASGSPAVSGGSAFGDVAENAYYADAVAWAEKNEITGGIGGGLFGSGNDCTRGQIVTLLYRAYQGK